MLTSVTPILRVSHRCRPVSTEHAHDQTALVLYREYQIQHHDACNVLFNKGVITIHSPGMIPGYWKLSSFFSSFMCSISRVHKHTHHHIQS